MLVSDVPLSGENRNELPYRRDIHHWRGNTRKIMFRMSDSTGQGLNLSGYTAKLAVKPVDRPGEQDEAYDDDNAVVCESQLANSEVNSAYVQDLTGGADAFGYVYIYLDDQDTDFPGGTYYYGIQLSGTDIDGKADVQTPFVGIWYQYEDIVDND